MAVLVDGRNAERRKREIAAERKRERAEWERRKRCGFERWVQVNHEHFGVLAWLAANYPAASAVLMCLVGEMDGVNAAECSQVWLCGRLGLSRDAVRRGVKILRDCGFVAVWKQGKSNAYAVNDDIFWRSWGGNRSRSKFPEGIRLDIENVNRAALKVDNNR